MLYPSTVLLLFFFLSGVVTIPLAFAQEVATGVNIRILGSTHGFGTHDIQSAHKDELGFYWLATYEGVYRFDGESATWYPKSFFGVDESLYFKLQEDGTGKLWITVAEKKQGKKVLHALFDPVLQSITAPEIAIKGYVDIQLGATIIHNDQPRIFLLAASGQVFELLGDRLLLCFTSDPAWNAPVQSIVRAPNDSLYALLKGGQLFCISAESKEFVSISVDDRAQKLITCGEKILMIAGTGRNRRHIIDHLSWQTHERLTQYKFPANYDLLYATGLADAWLALDGEYIHIYQSFPEKVQEVPVSIPYQACGTDFSGATFMSKIDNRYWIFDTRSVIIIELTAFPHQSYLTDDALGTSLRGIAEIAANRLLVATYDGPKQIDLSSQQIDKVFTDSNGAHFDLLMVKDTCWAGLYNSSLFYAVGRDSDYTKTHSQGHIAAPATTRIPFKDHAGQLWIGLDDGLGKLDYKHWEVRHVKKGMETLNGLVINAAQPTPDTSLFWLATNGGAYLLSTVANRIVDTLHFTQKKNISHIAYDDQGILWIVSKAGPTYFLDSSLTVLDSIQVYQEKWGNHVHAMLQDNSGNYWFPTDKGVICYEAALDIYHYFTKQNANLPFDEFNLCAWEKLADGRFALGGVGGLIVFDPLKVLARQYRQIDYAVWPTSIELTVEQQSVDLLRDYYPYTDDNLIHLPYEFNRLKLDFSYLDPMADDASYFYRINVGDRKGEWLLLAGSNIQLNRFASGRNSIEFAVQTGFHQEKIISTPLYLQVAQPWYLQLKWLTLWLLLLGIIIYVSNAIRLRQVEAEKQLLAKLVAERTSTIAQQRDQLQQLNAAKDKLFGLLGHELRAPLLGVVGMGKKIAFLLRKGQTNSLERISEQLDRYAEDSQTMLQNLLDWGRMMMQDIEPVQEEVNIQGVINDVLPPLSGSLEQKAIHLQQFNLNQSVYFDQEALKVILRNLLINATKFTPIGGHIAVSTAVKAEAPCIEVYNTGKGFSDIVLDNIKHPDFFYTAKGTAGEKGSGLGLRLSYSLAEQNGAQLHFANHPDGGAIVSLVFDRAAIK